MLLGRIGEAQRADPQLVELVENLTRGESSSHLSRYTLDDKGWLRRDGKLCILRDESLRKCLHDTAKVVEPNTLKEVEVERDSTIRLAPTGILGSKIKNLRKREVKLVKVQWEEDQGDATWETEEKIRLLYPFLFGVMSFIFSFIA